MVTALAINKTTALQICLPKWLRKILTDRHVKELSVIRVTEDVWFFPPSLVLLSTAFELYHFYTLSTFISVAWPKKKSLSPTTSSSCYWLQETPSLLLCWDHGYQVILSYDNTAAWTYNDLWPKIAYWWANTPDPKDLITFLEGQKKNGRPTGSWN